MNPEVFREKKKKKKPLNLDLSYMYFFPKRRKLFKAHEAA